jgi:thioredoxin-like negative regulator of GroEL
MLKGFLVAGGLAVAAAGLFSAGASAPDVIRDYDGADDAAALQRVVARESQDRFALVMFHQSWCPYCKKLTGQLQDAAAQTKVPYTVLKVDVADYPKLAATYKLQGGVPETHVYLNGQRTDVFVGSGPDTQTVVNYIDGLSRHYETPTTKPYISTPAPVPNRQ